ncbi:MAG TPA: hypothetical protein VFM58_21930 [Solirubrobacteraceae bacterium]|jgi:hypothetical protein|nr:hypothetical protein [Solirubrobacteraceae bacterium]
MFSRSTIAVGAVLAALGGLAAVALASGGDAAPTTAPAPSAETDPPVQVRTKVIRRTVHVRPHAAAAASPSGDDDGTLDQGPGDRPQIPVTAAPPVSGHDVGDDRGRHHGGDDDDFDDDRSGHGGGDDDSGHGHGGDDDHSGHGHGGDDD